jgi:uncharacterized membrane protein YdbT with pleckstrin-like domain
MSYVEQNLLGGETITFRTHLHWQVFIVPVLVALILCLPATLMLLMSEAKAAASIPFAFLFLLVLVPYVSRNTSEFAVTNKRVIVKVGILRTRSLELFLPKIEGIVVNQGLLGRFLNYGSIVITGSGGTKEGFPGIQRPLEFRRAVQQATDEGRAQTAIAADSRARR